MATPPELSNLTPSKRRRLIRKLKAEQRSKLPKVRPGKRQRAELKAQVFGSDQGSAAQQDKKRQKPLDGQAMANYAAKKAAKKLAKKLAKKAKKQEKAKRMTKKAKRLQLAKKAKRQQKAQV